MKKTVLMVAALLCTFACFSQVVDFEDLTLEPDSSWNGSDGTGQFTSSYLTLYNDYNSQYDSWQGFAYTNGTDTATNTFTNLSSCVGHGAGNSNYYVTGYIGTDWMGDNSQIPVAMKINTENAGNFDDRGAYFCMPVLLKKWVDGHYASNQFYFKLKASAYANGALVGEREIMMADFTEGHSYMMNDWTYVDLSWIENADSLDFIAICNDTAGGWGINTPMYFCMDNFGARNPYPEVVDFEEFELEPDTAWIGADGTGKFTSSYLTLYNTYEYYEDYGMSYWEGFAYTNGTDTETFDYDNLSAAVGHGHGNSSNYVTAYTGWYGKSGIKIDTEHSVNFENRGAYFCLPTLLVKHINQVDFATNHYYYSVKVTAYAAGEELDSHEIVMADYRTGANYMMNRWTFVDLSWIANADSLYFEALGNEYNDYGLNTPTYFCMDDFGAEAPNAITATASEGGFISPMGTVYVDDAENQSFTITPADCYQIASVTVDETDVTSELVNGVYTFENVTANHTIAATFEQITYTVAVTAGDNGAITHNDETGDAVVNCGEDMTFTITPAEGYMIETITVDEEEVATLNTYTFSNVTENHTIAATFTEIPEGSVVVMVNATEGGTVSPMGTQAVVSSQNLILTITPENCKKALVNGEEAEIDSENHHTIENITENMNVNVSFEHITYTIAASGDEFGTIDPAGDNVVNCGDNKTFTFVPADSCRLVSVMVDDVDTTASIVNNTFTFENVSGNHTIAATFQRIPTYTITVAETENGTITPNGIVTVLEGQDTTFTFVPADSCRLVSVMVDDVDTTASLVENTFTFVNVTGNHTLAATFEALPQPATYTITATAGEGGTITPAETTVEEGGNAEFTISASEGYRIASVIVDADTDEEVDVTDALENGVYSFENVTADHTIHATFEDATVPNTHTITLTVGEHGTVTASDEDDNEIAIVNDVITVNHGEDVYLKFTPEENYKIGTLTVNGTVYDLDEDEDEELGFTLPMLEITEDMTVSVTFTSVNATEMFEAGSMAVYPNPNNGMFSIDFSNIEGDATYQIINASGAVVETRDINVMNGETMNFNHDLKAGSYFVRIINGDKVYVEQIVIE